MEEQDKFIQTTKESSDLDLNEHKCGQVGHLLYQPRRALN